MEGQIMEKQASSQKNRFQRLCLPVLMGTLSCGLLVGLLAVLGAGQALAGPPGPSDLDTTFGGTGVITQVVGANESMATANTVQPDNRMLVVGVDRIGTEWSGAMLCYTTSGQLALPLYSESRSSRPKAATAAEKRKLSLASPARMRPGSATAVVSSRLAVPWGGL